MAESVVTIERNVHLDRLMSSHPEMRKQLNKIIGQVLNKARTAVQGAARDAMEKDPRAAYKAVRRMIYKRILGGNINILTPRRAGNKSYVPDPTPARTGRGGNRIKRSADTERMMSYYGADRGMILRWVNAGTATRTTRYGNRGSISAHNWFAPASQSAIERAVEQLQSIIDQTIAETKV